MIAAFKCRPNCRHATVKRQEKEVVVFDSFSLTPVIIHTAPKEKYIDIEMIIQKSTEIFYY